MARVRQIVVRLERPEQLFTADPVSPTSPRYSEYTAQPAMETVRELLIMRMPSKQSEVELHVILPPDQVRDGLAAELTQAVRRWIKVQNTLDVELASAGGAVGRRLFILGFVAFFLLQLASITVKKLGDASDDYFIDALGEGLGVASWVMLWFPVQTFTVEVWRSNIRRRRMDVIERMNVAVFAQEPTPT
jgi:hypothetical protein